MYAGASQEQFTQSNQRFLAAMITSPEDVEKVASLGAKSNPKAVGQAAFELFTTDLRPGLKSIQAPVLLIGAGAAATDEATKAQIEKAYADQIAAIPRHKLAFAPRARHFVQLDAPQFFYAEVDDFLKENQK
jgi:pimeloyl-ACP methyl ester carboxylesterase